MLVQLWGEGQAESSASLRFLWARYAELSYLNFCLICLWTYTRTYNPFAIPFRSSITIDTNHDFHNNAAWS